MIPDSTIDRQIDSMSRRVASIDPGPLALAVKSLMEDLTSRHPGITITDMVKADLTIAGVLGQHDGGVYADGGAKRGRPRDPENVHPSVGTTWALVGALARLVVLSHVVELDHYGDFKASMMLMRNPAPLDGASFQPTGTAVVDRQATLLLEDHGEMFPMSLEIPWDVDRALRSLGKDEMASGWDVSSMKDVMPKIMVELAGLEDYDLGTVRAYVASQHEFVLSEIGLSMSYGNGDHIAPEILSHRKGMVDRVFTSLLYGCNHATAVSDGGDADPAGLTAAGLDAEGQDQRSKRVDWCRVPVPVEVAGAPMAAKRFLMMAVLGSCRLRDGGEVYDAMSLGRRFQDVLPLSPVDPLDGEDRERLVEALKSLDYDVSLYNWSKGLCYEIAVMRRMGGVVTKESEHRSRDIGHLFTTGEDAFATKRTKPLWAFMGDHGWDDDDLDRFRMPSGRVTIDFRELDVDGETPLSGSVVSLLPCDVRRRYDESRLRGIEAKDASSGRVPTYGRLGCEDG